MLRLDSQLARHPNILYIADLVLVSEIKNQMRYISQAKRIDSKLARVPVIINRVMALMLVGLP